MDNKNDLPMAESQVEKMLELCAASKEWRPSHGEALREHEINIRFLSRGCVVRVGCKEIAFEDHTYAMAQINAYVNNPWEEQKKWRKILD